MKPRRLAGLGLLLALLAHASAAEERDTLGVGGTLPPITLEDQHGVSHTVGPEVKLLLFARGMDSGDLVRDALADETGASLAARGVVYVADISGMPRLVARLFALPAMRRRPYPILLDRDGKATAVLPSREGRVALIGLDHGVVTSVSHVGTVDAVRAALGPPPAAGSPANPAE